MTDAYVLHERPELESPVLVACLHGWIDVGAGGASAMEALESEVAEVEVATFDGVSLLIADSERPSLVAVNDLTDPAAKVLKKIMPSGITRSVMTTS